MKNLKNYLRNATMEHKLDLVCYLSNGYPNAEATLENAEVYIKGGCDVIEIDLPTDNPYIDGEKLQKRMIASYKSDPTLQSHIETFSRLRKKYLNQRFIILAYEKTIVQIGIERFISVYKENEIEALILVGNKDDQIKNELMENNVSVVSYVEKSLTKKAIENANSSNSFIYLQAKSEEKKYLDDLKSTIEKLKNEIDNEKKVYCGVGIASAKDIGKVKVSGANGVFVGSAVFTKESDKQLMENFIAKLKQNT